MKIKNEIRLLIVFIFDPFDRYIGFVPSSVHWDGLTLAIEVAIAT
jgi:hypothetical protein